MKSENVIFDLYDFIMQNLFSLCMVLMYILPILRMTSRIVTEKHTGISDFMYILSL
jgi:hypothetical protein